VNICIQLCVYVSPTTEPTDPGSGRTSKKVGSGLLGSTRENTLNDPNGGTWNRNFKLFKSFFSNGIFSKSYMYVKKLICQFLNHNNFQIKFMQQKISNTAEN
jgi:hypothetical protein